MEFLRKYKESIMYLIFGGLTVVVNLVTYLLLTRISDVNYMLANVIAWAAAVLFAYVTNKFFVFESKDISFKFLAKEFMTFVNCRLLSGAIDMILIYIMVNFINMNDFIVKIICNIIVIILNYVLSKRIIFKREEIS